VARLIATSHEVLKEMAGGALLYCPAPSPNIKISAYTHCSCGALKLHLKTLNQMLKDGYIKAHGYDADWHSFIITEKGLAYAK
jgi:protein-disulfide isomerase